MEYLIDTHTHLTSKEFDADREEVIARAHAAGVKYLVNPSTTVDDSRKAVALAESHPGVYACAGIHPHEAKSGDEEALRAIEEISRHPKVVAIGEIGIDYHYDFAPREVQQDVFRRQLEIAVRRDLPAVIHTRESEEDTIRIVEETVAAHPEWRNPGGVEAGRYPRPRGVFHCFPGDPDLAWHVIKMGFAVSMPGIVTFKNPGNAALVAAKVSAEHLLLETDSPYLAPVPHRGKRNEPSYLPLVAEKIAAEQHLTVRDIARATSYGAYLLFGIGDAPGPETVYRLKNSLYINLTIRCNADCVFCDRKGTAVIKGHNLKITSEPTAEEVIAQIGDPKGVDEVVFCGYGEPTIRLDALKEVARWVKANGGKTRLNTDGHGSVINGRNIVPELAGLIDSVSISLNSTDPEQYGQLMRLDGKRFFPAMVDFAREAVKVLPKVVMTVVDLNEVDKTKAKKLVEEEIGAVFSTRAFF